MSKRKDRKEYMENTLEFGIVFGNALALWKAIEKCPLLDEEDLDEYVAVLDPMITRLANRADSWVGKQKGN